MILSPADILDGGISGVSMLLSKFTVVPLSVYLCVLNLAFYIIGYKKISKDFVFKSLTAIFSYSLFAFVIQNIFHLDELIFDLLKEDILLCSLFGGLISGVGSGLTIKFGGAIDGIDVMSVLFAKKLSLTVGSFVMIFNAIFYMISGIITNNIYISLYSIIAYFVGVKTVDYVVEGFDRAKSIIIVTSKAKIIASTLSKKLGRGITLINSKGYYSKEEKTMMYCCINRFEVSRVKQIVRSIDQDAFMTISDISEVVGSKKIKYSLNRKKQVDNMKETITSKEH